MNKRYRRPKKKHIKTDVSDFRSDTVTRPTEEMRLAMYKAEVGDDVLGDDMTVKKLEALAAVKTGKESALFVPSGTMANELAVKIWTHEGEEIILDFLSHIYCHEVSGISLLSRVMPKPLNYIGGIPSCAEIENHIVKEDPFHFRTSLICIENTHNHRGGAVIPMEPFKELHRIAAKHDVKIHMDGARIFNASVASGVKITDYCRYVDSLMFCLSKGLSAPVGSMLCGPANFIEQARRWRRVLGGSMRQAGIIAAAGIVALNTMIERLKDDHRRARILADELSHLPGIYLNAAKVRTNIVIFQFKHPRLTTQEFLNKLSIQGILALTMSENEVRFVTHKDINDNDISRAIDECKKILENH